MTQLYADILKTQQRQIICDERKYTKGLDKLKEIEDIVAELEVT